MPKLRTIALLLACLCLVPQVTRAAETNETEITIQAEEGLEVDFATGFITYKGNVILKYGAATLSAENARYNPNTGDAIAEGSVRLQQENDVWYGERIEYNFKTGKVLASEFRAGQPPFFLRGDALAGDNTNRVYVLIDGIVTTDDYSEPGYRIRASELTIAPGDYIAARNATLYIKDVPVFWFPKWRRSLKRHPNHWVIVPGYRNKYGAYALNSYNWYLNEKLRGAIHLDARSRRGVGVGPDLEYNLPRFGEGSLKYYYTYDDKPEEDARGRPIDEDRQRFWFTHQGTLRTNLTLRSAVRYQSDSQIIRDFFESEYRQNTQPSTYVELNQLWSNWSLNLLAQPRVNRYQETVERLPDLKLTGFRQRIGPTPFFYESDSSIGYFQRQFPYTDTNRFNAFRADTFHQLLLPWTFFGWLNLTPKAGGRFTHYGEADGSGAFTDEEQRTVFNTGAELSFKASRTWRGIRNKTWQVDGFRHIVQPAFNYAFVPNPSVNPRNLPAFDYELPTAELLPIDFPEYNSIDSIDSQNVLRLGLENKLQTKREDALGRSKIDNFVYWSLYTDWRIRPQSNEEDFSDVYSKLALRPLNSLTLSSYLAMNVEQKKFDQVNHAITYSPNDVWSWTIGERYLRTGAFYGTNVGNNLVFSSLYVRLSQNWAARGLHYYNVEESSMQRQTYSLYRDLRSWTIALSFRLLKSEGDDDDYSVALTFSSKAFPRFGLGQDINRPTQSLGF